MNREDNFGDHKLTGTGRVDATARAPFEMGLGGKKKKYIMCPKCGKVICVKTTTIRIMCGDCRCDFSIDEAKKPTIDEIWKSHKGRRLSTEYHKMREKSEVRAEKYINRKKR